MRTPETVCIDDAAEPAKRLHRLVEQHGRAVRGTLRGLGVADGDLDDAAQRVFLTALRKLPRIPEGNERAFLHAVAAREASHVRRTYRRRRESTDTELECEQSDSLRPDMLAVRKARATTLGKLLGQMN